MPLIHIEQQKNYPYSQPNGKNAAGDKAHSGKQQQKAGNRPSPCRKRGDSGNVFVPQAKGNDQSDTKQTRSNE
ncbi:MAG: hypothetical protein OHK0029_31120 [Armatimonadaceae bacterium]